MIIINITIAALATLICTLRFYQRRYLWAVAWLAVLLMNLLAVYRQLP